VFEPVYFEQSCHGVVRGAVMTMTGRRRAEGLPTPNDEIVGRAETLFQAWLGVMWWGIIDTIRVDPVASERLVDWVRPAVELDR
jgi:hypothetical protein